MARWFFGRLGMVGRVAPLGEIAQSARNQTATRKIQRAATHQGYSPFSLLGAEGVTLSTATFNS